VEIVLAISYYNIDIHRGGLQGTILFKYPNSDLETPQDFEFDIEYEPDHWFPLKDGKYQGRLWSTWPSNTRIGWRGPMLKKEVLEQLPSIFWEDE
jgi:hypothetical protein